MCCERTSPTIYGGLGKVLCLSDRVILTPHWADACHLCYPGAVTHCVIWYVSVNARHAGPTQPARQAWEEGRWNRAEERRPHGWGSPGRRKGEEPGSGRYQSNVEILKQRLDGHLLEMPQSGFSCFKQGIGLDNLLPWVYNFSLTYATIFSFPVVKIGKGRSTQLHSNCLIYFHFPWSSCDGLRGIIPCLLVLIGWRMTSFWAAANGTGSMG